MLDVHHGRIPPESWTVACYIESFKNRNVLTFRELRIIKTKQEFKEIWPK